MPDSSPNSFKDPLTHDQLALLRQGCDLFNRGEFFECHEALEAVWLESSGERKTFLQGLIQITVAFYHLRRGNLAGARRLLEAGIEKLSSSPAEARVVETESLVSGLRPVAEQLESGTADTDHPAPRFQILDR